MTDNEIELALETIALVLEDLKKTQEKQQAAITAIKQTLAEHAMKEVQKLGQEIEQEPVAWRNAAIRVGEDLSSVGPDGYYDMTAQQWLDWALSVVTVHAPPPQRTWVGLTKNERLELYRQFEDFLESDDCEYEKAIEQALKERNQ